MNLANRWLLFAMGVVLMALFLAVPGLCARASMPKGTHDVRELAKKLKRGMTTAQVIAIAGNPDKEFNHGDGSLLIYHDINRKGGLGVSLYKERVQDVQVSHLDLPAKD